MKMQEYENSYYEKVYLLIYILNIHCIKMMFLPSEIVLTEVFLYTKMKLT